MKLYKRIFKDSNMSEYEVDYLNNRFIESIKTYRLKEKTFNLDKDVDYIYNKFFKSYVDDYIKNGTPPEIKEYGVVLSSELKTKESIEAHKKYPIQIICGAFNEASKIFFTKGKERIIISIHAYVVEALKYYPTIDIDLKDKKIFDTEISEHRIKASIYHELSHWVSDANYNSYLHDLIAKTRNIIPFTDEGKNKIKKIMSLGKPDVDMTHYEIDAQIHAIKQIKRYYGDTWNDISLSDVFYRYYPLTGIAKKLYAMGEDIYKAWVKDLIKRMNRENLLGKSMIEIPDYKLLEMRVFKREFALDFN